MKIAILFGPENSGLSNQDLRLANLFILLKLLNLINHLIYHMLYLLFLHELFSQNIKII